MTALKRLEQNDCRTSDSVPDIMNVLCSVCRQIGILRWLYREVGQIVLHSVNRGSMSASYKISNTRIRKVV